MKILFNQSELDLKGSTIEDLLSETRSDKEKGFVVAVNNHIIFKHNWKVFQLKEADKVLTILPTYGG